MPRFFVDAPMTNFFEVTGDDASHIAKSLRMRCGELLTLCHDGMDYDCKIVSFEENSVQVELVSARKCESEPQLKVVLFQGIPKSDKMDLIVQKAVEVGVSAIVPVFTGRCVSRPDEKSLQKKLMRWQKIALEAAKQSGRGCVPKVFPALSFDAAVKFAENYEKRVLFYENGGIPLQKVIGKNVSSVAVFVGPEGGFEHSEVDLVRAANSEICSLGKRILRTETAAVVSVALAVYEAERLE